ncbi:MAG: DUF2889 domain-containing protein [Spirochaetota bacterium]|nr:DUF2889 domain-containing protein [Spirochaetota bacterium]
MTVSFIRNKIVEVEPLPEGALSISWRLTDDLHDFNIQLTVQQPDLEITSAKADVRRSPHQDGVSALELIQNVIGVRIGPGLRKIVIGLMGGKKGNVDLTEGVLECCNAVILNYTLPGIRLGDSMKDATEEERIAGARAMLKSNPRLKQSCIAFADDSPIMKGVDI